MISLRCSLILVVFLIACGCSTSNDKAGILDATGKHPASWVQKHASFFRQNPGATDDPAAAQATSCTECHGKDLKGGNVKVSCFSQSFGAMTCHFHPAGYTSPQNHGAIAKAAPSFSSGLDSCRGCHGSGYAGGFLSSVSCFTCHGVSAPHAKNWATSTTSDHSTSDPGNAAACYQCHAGGRLLTNLPAPPAQPAGTAPGCFNNTLCHGAMGAPHAVPLGAGGYPGASHKGTVSTTTCLACHPAFAAGSPYPAAPSGSAPNCRGCHLNANPSTDPKCSDCHGSTTNDGSGATLAGRPSGTPNSFPNQLGQHNRSQHIVACTTCHPFTTGDTRHGWSNRTKSTAAQVGGTGTSITSWNPATKSCTPACHEPQTW